MIGKIGRLLKRHMDVLCYLFFGGCTTVVNFVAYWLSAYLLGLSTGASTVTAWVVSVAFAYVTNKLWAFHSPSWRLRLVLKEAVSFLACRLATGAFDVVFMLVMVDIFCLNDLLMKIASNVVVVVANYVASKAIIFRSR